MSGWDSSSRPTWDPQGEAGEHTQSFGVPDLPEDGGFPSSSTPGTPPAIFLQDYDQNDIAQDDFGQGDFGRSHPGRGDFGQDEFGRGSTRQNGFSQDEFGRDASRQNGFGQQDRGLGDFGGSDFGGSDFGAGDFGRGDFGHGRDEDLGQRSHGQRGPAQRDYDRQDYPQQDNQRQGAARDQWSRDFPSADRQDPAGAQDADFGARMDPALRDFFAPQPPRQDQPQQGFVPQRPGPRGYQGQGQGQGQSQGQQGPAPVRGPGHRPGGAGPQVPQPSGPGCGQANGYGQPPGGLGQAPPDRWDTPPQQRPGSRTARRQESLNEHHGRSKAGMAIVLVVVIGVAIGVVAYLLMRGKPAVPASQGGPAYGATPGTHAAKSPGAVTTGRGTRGAATAGYTLKKPATAGGYTRLASVPASVATAAGATSAAIRDAAVNDGGKVTSQVKAAYQLSGGQVLSFTGFDGRFNPAKVLASLATLGTDSHTEAAGPHGGKLACAVAPATPSAPGGTVCMWVTTTTIGITEFFGSNGPEVVSRQSKAAADALKLRNSVEVPRP
jgi:hypothetical protein